MCDWLERKNRALPDNRIQKFLNSKFEEKTSPVIEKTIAQLDEYFLGRRAKFDIPLLFLGTDFQKKVWNKLLEIPYGKTISYAELAKALNAPKAVRAVANACGANTISIFAPCHRVIASNNALGGYAGGLHLKDFLLNLEFRLP